MVRWAESEVRMKDVLSQLQNFQQSRREIQIPSFQALGETSYETKESRDKQMLPSNIEELDA